MGDFNINLLNYNHHMETHKYVDAMFSNSLVTQITNPTSITPTTATLINNICRNDIFDEYIQSASRNIIFIHFWSFTNMYTIQESTSNYYNIFWNNNHLSELTNICLKLHSNRNHSEVPSSSYDSCLSPSTIRQNDFLYGTSLTSDSSK
jgi:hypothetical protein